MSIMKAAVIYEAGVGPEVLKVETRTNPKPMAGQVLIRVEAFGPNRSEFFTHQDFSPNVKFPRIHGIEAVDIVEASRGHSFEKGDIVATAMGGMGRSYAEYTCPAARQVQVIKTDLDWKTLCVIPEML
jgi:NADPH:quinone reductase-like Zn-dependent oxidoreductase